MEKGRNADRRKGVRRNTIVFLPARFDANVLLVA
jgi:hypothetical protein